jgi:hypothetical protein
VERPTAGWRRASAFRKAFNALREELVKQHPFFPTRYCIGIDPLDPLRLPTSHLTMRTMRHTCVTLSHDAGVPRELISSITGHEPANIDAVLAHYTVRTADQATTALNMRVAHEAKDTQVPKVERLYAFDPGRSTSCPQCSQLWKTADRHKTPARLQYCTMVPPVGLEPTLREEPDFESGASTNSATGARCRAA